jgi:hypothetical protein
MAGDHRPPRATRNALTADRQAAFVVASARFVEDLRKGVSIRPFDDDSLSDLGDTLARLGGVPTNPDSCSTHCNHQPSTRSTTP